MQIFYRGRHLPSKRLDTNKSIFAKPIVLYTNHFMTMMRVGCKKSWQNLSSLFHDHSSSFYIFFYKQNTHTHTPTVATKILNFRTESKKVNINGSPSSCACQSSSHIHQPLGHVITGDLSIITNPKLRAVFEKGPKFREPGIVSLPKNYDLIKNAVRQCQEKWASRLRVPQVVLEEWVTTVLSKVHAKIESLSRKGSACVVKSIFADREVQQSLKDLHERYVVTTADKAGFLFVRNFTTSVFLVN